MQNVTLHQLSHMMSLMSMQRDIKQSKVNFILNKVLWKDSLVIFTEFFSS